MSLESYPNNSAKRYERSFFEEQKGHLRDLFTALGRASLWSDNLVDLIPYTQTRWRGKEHGMSPEKDVFKQDDIQVAWPILKDMGLIDEILPSETTTVDQIVIVGGLMRANHERLRFVKDLLDEERIITQGPITFWAGQRHRYDAESASPNDMFNPSGRYPGYDDRRNDWVSRQRQMDWMGSDIWERSIATETETARLAVTRIFDPELVTNKILLRPSPAIRYGSVPPRIIQDYHYTPKDYPEIIITNAAAVARSHGEPRHTTTSCAEEFIEQYTPPLDSSILFVSGNPHTRRTADDVTRVFMQHGREDIDLIPVGPAMRQGAPIQLALGEVASLLFWSQPDIKPENLTLSRQNHRQT